jgi:hypothetical protein
MKKKKMKHIMKKYVKALCSGNTSQSQRYVSPFGNPTGNKPVTMASYGRIMADYSV